MANIINQDKIIWIAWERHRRTIELCRYFNIDLIAYQSNRNRLLKHPIFAVKSIYDIVKQNPQVLIVQNPSILLTLIACILKQILNYKLVVDTHNAAILPDSIMLKKLSFLYKYFQRKADITIVTNKKLEDIVLSNNGVPFVMPDKLPDINIVQNKTSLGGNFKIACICTFGKDEPYEQLMEAAGNFNKNIIFYITGNIKKLPNKLFCEKPDNVNFTGFLPENDYWELLFSSDLIIDLTKRENCLVCGAYEAVAAEVPIILSDTQALRNHFYKGTVFTKNTAEDIVINITYAIENKNNLNKEVVDLKNELNMKWSEIAENFKRLFIDDWTLRR